MQTKFRGLPHSVFEPVRYWFCWLKSLLVSVFWKVDLFAETLLLKFVFTKSLFGVERAFSLS